MKKSTIGEKLLNYRNSNKLTQQEMAKKLEASLSSYRNWEMDVTKPNEENLIKVLKITE